MNTRTGLLGFPSAFAAFKWLDAEAQGPVSWMLNGHPSIQKYSPDLPISEESRAEWWSALSAPTDWEADDARDDYGMGPDFGEDIDDGYYPSQEDL